MADVGAERERQRQLLRGHFATVAAAIQSENMQPAIVVPELVLFMAAMSAAVIEGTDAVPAEFERHTVALFKQRLAAILANSAAAARTVVH